MNLLNRHPESLKTVSTSQGRAVSALLALTVCAFVLAPLPALAQDAPADSAAEAQDVDMPREVRVLVQRGLAVLGFDPGPADGLFGPKTRAAIWDWQTAKELGATGYLTMPEAEALAAVGAEVSETLEMEFEEPVEREPESAEAETVTTPSGSQNQILYFPNCSTADAGPDGCWKALVSPAECVYWLPTLYFEEQNVDLFWSGECDEAGRATGRGMMEWIGEATMPGGVKVETKVTTSGEIVEGRQEGPWVINIRVGEDEDETVYRMETSFLNGLQHGRRSVRILRLGGRDYEDEYEDVSEFRHGELVE